MAQLVASMSGVVLGGVVEVVGSNLARGKIFTASIGSVDSLYPWIIKLPGLASYLFYQYHCLRVNRVYAEINTFLPPYSKRLFIAMIHRKVFNIKIVNIHFKWRKFLRNIRE